MVRPILIRGDGKTLQFHHFLLRFVLAGPGIVDEAGGRA